MHAHTFAVHVKKYIYIINGYIGISSRMSSCMAGTRLKTMASGGEEAAGKGRHRLKMGRGRG